MPAQLAATVAKSEVAWISEQERLHVLFPDKLGELAVYLARGQEVDAALDVLREVLALRTPMEGQDFGEAKLEDWHYGNLLHEQFPQVLEAVGERALWLLCDLLEQGMDRERAARRLSSLWRAAIEDHEQNRRMGNPEDHLLDAIRDGLASTLRRSPERVAGTLERLDGKSSELFHRLALYLVAELADIAPQFARDRLLCEDNFKNHGLHHEYSLLTRKVFPLLRSMDREVFIGWILKEGKPDDAEDDEERRAAEHELARRLAIIHDHLPADLLNKYATLLENPGIYEHPDFLVFHRSWVGPRSPKSVDEMKTLPLKEIAQFLRSWKAPDKWESPTFEGLARELTRVVRERAAEVSANLNIFLDVDSTYARAVIEGIYEALKAGFNPPWSQVLSYASWIVTRDRAASFDPKQTLDRDPHWGWARTAVARLIEVALDRRMIPADMAHSVWEALEPITNDPNPEPKDNDDLSDVVNRSINATRPVAMHAAIAFTSWLRTMEDADGRQHDAFKVGVGKVLAMLDEHLDPRIDPSPSVRSVYGQYIEWLAYLDNAWLLERIPRIFSNSHPGLREAAWLGYLSRSRLHDQVFRILQDEYENAVERLGARGRETRSRKEPDRRLGEHLMILVGRGTLRLDESLLSRFFTVAPPEVRAAAVGYVGRALCSEGVEVDEAFLTNWKNFWEWRNQASAPQISPLEQAEFGWWFVSGRFEDDWSFDKFADALRKSKTIEAEPFVLEHLARIAGHRPREALEVLELLVNLLGPGRGMFGFPEHAIEILRICLRDSDARSRATVLIHKLGAKRHFEFRDLLGK